MSLENRRDIRFDWMRGVGILLMMLGHVPVEGWTYRLIYSFHMPMFFLLSGYFAKSNMFIIGGGNSLITSCSRRMIVPLFTTLCAIVAVQWGTGCEIGHVMGPLWFLLALFWARLGYGLICKLNEKWQLWVGIMVGLLAWIVSLYWIEQRLFIIHGLCAIPFIAIGHYVRQNGLPTWMRWSAIGIWVIAVLFSHLEMRACSFGCWPIDVIGGCGGTVGLLLIAECLVKSERIRDSVGMRGITWCGRYSMAILCMHGVEWKALLLLEEQICSGYWLLLLRIIVTMVLAIIVVYTPGLKRIYR